MIFSSKYSQRFVKLLRYLPHQYFDSEAMGGNNILVIDDSNTNLVLLESLLVKDGYRVKSVLSAKEGLAYIDKEIPDLIYLDFLMPDIDGLEFIRLLKKKESGKDIPIVMLSAISDKEIIRQCLALGVIDYITKPINIHKISELTDRLLSN